ncbi:hypothetical protein CBOM_03715 [Ceraceosorus bombacis]|uniref:Uncharacterized protein n=1 Tax=Ceraceosorus bombacis TaxID=401625 RepID=A0A0P1BHW0_9BASI|nr:hypothetical protein CBOM_03715 [Ceraceosorus bombacis]
MSAASDLASPGPSAELSAGAANAQFLRLVGQHRPIGPHKHFNSIPVLVALSRRSTIKREPDEEQEEGRDGSRDQTVELEGESGGSGATDADAEIATLDGHVIRLRLDELYDVKGLEELEEAATRTQFGLRSESASRSSSPEADDHETSGMSRHASWKHPRFGSGILRLAGVGGRSRTSTASSAVEGDAGAGSARSQTPLGHSLLPSIIAKGSRHEFGLPFDDGFDDLVHARRLLSAGPKHNVSSDDELSDIDPDREHDGEETDEGDDAKVDAEQQEEDEEEGGEAREAQEKPRRTRGSTQRSSKRRKTEKEAADGDRDHEETNAAEEEEEQDEDEEEQNEDVDDDDEEEEEDEAQSTRSGRRGGQSSAEQNSRKRTRSNRSSTAAAQPASASKAGTKKKGQSDASGSSLAVEQGQPSKSTRSSTAPRRSTRR